MTKKAGIEKWKKQRRMEYLVIKEYRVQGSVTGGVGMHKVSSVFCRC
jgi:hypothetical protein